MVGVASRMCRRQMLLLGFGAAMLLLSACASNDALQQSPPEPSGPKSYGVCEVDDYCILISCRGKYVVHRNVLDDIGAFQSEWCGEHPIDIDGSGSICNAYNQCVFKPLNQSYYNISEVPNRGPLTSQAFPSDSVKEENKIDEQNEQETQSQ